MSISLQDIENELRNSPGEWRYHATTVIHEVPSGYICTYGEIAREVNRRTGSQINARNIGWLRKYLYQRTNRETTIPLHRIAKQGDTVCEFDSERTRRDTRAVRTQEGSWDNSRWWSF